MAFSSFIKISVISLILLSILSFFLIFTNHHPKKPLSFAIIPHRSLLNTSSSSCSSILETPLDRRCSFSLSNCNGDSNSLFNYSSLHFCIFKENSFLTIPSLVLILLLQFYFLVKTAQDRFSIVVTKLATHLNLSPSMGAVTLLALGNGAPDVFASVAAVRGGHPRTGLGAILSAGTFVSAFVVGFVAIYAAPFTVDPAPFVRDVFFYLTAALSLFYVYLSAEIFLWQAIGFVGFYVFFVGFVFWMDLKVEGDRGKNGAEMVPLVDVQKGYANFDVEGGVGNLDGKKPDAGLCGFARKVHTKKRNRLEQQKLNDLVYVKYNQCLVERFNLRDVLDPILVAELIEDSNEWLDGELNEDAGEDVVHPGSDLQWRDVERARNDGEASGSGVRTTRAQTQPSITRTYSRSSNQGGRGRGRGARMTLRDEDDDDGEGEQANEDWLDDDQDANDDLNLDEDLA